MLRVVLVGAAVAAIALSAASGASAQARTSESFQFSDPLTGNFDCGAFTVTISGQDKGHVKTWFDRAGNPIMQVGHIKANEVDTNDSTGKAILIRTAIAVHVDFLDDARLTVIGLGPFDRTGFWSRDSARGARGDRPRRRADLAQR
jgi:hypothetical protein